MKLIDILLENSTKKEYMSSLKNLFGSEISIKKNGDSDILTIKINTHKETPEVFEKLVNNHFIRNITLPNDSDILKKISEHDIVFSKSKRLQIKG